MAYNPFNFFRRNSKILFAVITIFVMFTFVLSFGQGDFFTWFPRWLGEQKSYGDVLAEVDGRSVRDSDMRKVQDKRQVANGFMNALAERQFAGLLRKTQELQDGLQGGKSKLSQEHQFAILIPLFQRDSMWRRVRDSRTQDDAETSLESLRQTLLVGQAQLADLQKKSTMKQDDKEAAETVIQLFRADLTRLAVAATSTQGESRLYFANMPNGTPRDRLEYLLWLKKADQLGIRYTDDDVKGMVDREFPGLTDADRAKVLADALSDRRTSKDDFYAALADEFRVRAAQTAVLGPLDVRFFGGFPTAVPYDLYEFYRKQTDRSRFAFLTVPVEPFVKLVEDQLKEKALAEPDDKELQKIFREAKATVPSPGSPKAGVVEPAKAVVQWVEVTGQEAFYSPLVDERLKRMTDARVSLMFALPLGGGVFGNAVAPFALKDQKYEQYKETQTEIARLWGAKQSNPGLPRTDVTALASAFGGAVLADPVVTSRLLREATKDPTAKLADESLAKPHNVGILAGLFGGSFGTGGSLLTAPVILTETGYSAERERRLLAGIQGFVLPTLAGPHTLMDTLAGELAVFANNPKPLPQPVVQPILDAISKQQLRGVVVEDDLREFQKKLGEMMKGEDKEAAGEQAKVYVAKFIADRGLKGGVSSQLRDVHSIADEPALAPLIPKSGLTNQLGVLGNQALKSAFGQTFFIARKPNPMNLRQPQWVPAAGTYDPVPYPPDAELVPPAEGNPVFLTWRTVETKQEQPREFTETGVREKCLAIWKRNKARELARKAAESAVEVVKAAGDSPDKVNQNLQDALKALTGRFKDAADSSRFKLIEGDQYEVANLVRDKTLAPDESSALRPFGLLRGDVFVYPTQKMLEELLANRDKPVGTAVVLADAPETTLYVAVLESKREQTPTDFQREVFKPVRPTQAQEAVRTRYAVEARKAARETAVELLKAEFRYTNENPSLDKKADDADKNRGL